jgi:hypothetical protein
MLPHDLAIGVEVSVKDALLGESVHAVSKEKSHVGNRSPCSRGQSQLCHKKVARLQGIVLRRAISALD